MTRPTSLLDHRSERQTPLTGDSRLPTKKALAPSQRHRDLKSDCAQGLPSLFENEPAVLHGLGRYFDFNNQRRPHQSRL